MIDLTNVLLGYQKRWISDPARYAICEKGRQEGFTYCEAFWSVRRRLTHKINHYFCSTSDDTAKGFIEYCRQWAEAFNLALGETVIDLSKCLTTESLVFPNGSRIQTLSSNPSALRSRSGADVTWDEAAHHKQDTDWYSAAEAVTNWKNASFRILSTHNGTNTVFYDLCRKAQDQIGLFKHHKVTIYDAIRDGLALKMPGDHLKHFPDIDKVNEAFLAWLRAKALNKEAFGQEYECRALALGTLLSDAEYDGCVFDHIESLKIHDSLNYNIKYNPLYIGIDIGRSHDLTVVWVLERIENKQAVHVEQRYDYRTVCIKFIFNQPINVQWEMIKPILMHPSVAGIIWDAGFNGFGLVDLFKEHLGMGEGIIFSNTIKATIFERLKGYMQTKRINLPGDKLIRDDFLALRRIVGEGGTVGYSGHTATTHCDFIAAAAAALEAATRAAGAGISMIERNRNIIIPSPGNMIIESMKGS